MNKFRYLDIIEFMDTRFLTDNYHLENPERFAEFDPQLQQLKSQQYVFQFPLLDQLPVDHPGIYTLAGTYKTGKTTLLKQWMQKLVEKGIAAEAIAFLSCELIDDYHMLQRLLQKQLSIMPKQKKIYVILDDISAVRDWIKAIKTLANEKMLDHVVLLLSGSYMKLKQRVQGEFPDRPNQSKQLDFRLFPLSFRESVLLKQHNHPTPDVLYEEFNAYLQHGGYIHVINEMAALEHIQDKTLTTFVERIVKDIERQGKQARFLREILSAMIKHYNQPVSWNTLARELTINHPKTIGDYFESLESMGVVFIQYALLENEMKPAPKKARKVMFTDPLIYHAAQAWLFPGKHCYETRIKPVFDHSELLSTLVKTCVITQFQRYFPTFYIKGGGEVTLAYVVNQGFWPIEITWTERIRAKNLKQILKYSNGRILTKTERSGIIEHIMTEPLPLALWKLERMSS